MPSMTVAHVVLVALVLLSSPAAAEQVSEWKSDSGATIRLKGTDQHQFQVIVLAADGTSRIGHGSWIEAPNTFTYNFNDGGGAFQCSFINEGWGIRVVGRNQTRVWNFVRWISK